MPDELTYRPAELYEPLLSVADPAGGLARRAQDLEQDLAERLRDRRPSAGCGRPHCEQDQIVLLQGRCHAVQ